MEDQRYEELNSFCGALSQEVRNLISDRIKTQFPNDQDMGQQAFLAVGTELGAMANALAIVTGRNEATKDYHESLVVIEIERLSSMAKPA